jgi:hypothetical protein
MKIGKTSFLFGCLLLTLTMAGQVSADSLWDSDFSGYLTSKTAVQEGDIVLIRIDASSSLSFDASSSDSSNVTFEFSGGEFGNLFAFLPSVRTDGNESASGSQEYAFQTEVAARVTGLDETGKARVEGIRSFNVGNKEELVSITGWIDPGTLGPDRRVAFSQLADARLRFRTFLQPSGTTLTAADIEEVIETIEIPRAAPAPAGEQVEGAEEAAPGARAPAVQPPAGQPEPLIEERRSYQLSQEKKIELFLSYINRMVDLLFQ